MATIISTNVLKQEADDHLRDIRKRKGVDVSNGQQSNNVEDLNRALNILSDQLYKKPTHFLLELIQNADDNTFESDIPTISLTLDIATDNYLRIDCNEVGFNKANVEALCRIGFSTKKDKERTKGYIGEKGIGFKSIFKVADTVHISSKGYAFKFDRRSMLGMIAPIIEAFPPEHLKIGQTQTFLEIKGNAEYKDIHIELEKLQPQILIFLRKIRKLVIYTPRMGKRQFDIRRLNQDADFDGEETAILTSRCSRDNKPTEHRYIIVRRIETTLEKDDRRENITETETVLAFPIDEEMRPVLHDQHTYAYLPIDDYGFNYLIQGDFLLIANRESVDSSRWNDSVLTGVLRTFVRRAVPRFNEIHGSSPSLRYMWPLFLMDNGGTDKFWSKLKRWIFSRLAKRDVLECRHNMDLSRPDSLFYIPSEFRFKGEPLVEDEKITPYHLSFAYDPEISQILPQLTRMGVKVMSFLDFYTELRALIARRGISFLKGKSNQWHSKVAGLFYREGSVSQLQHIPLIPLHDGRWVTTSQGNVFLEEDTSRTAVPGGLDINLVDAEACQDANRKDFFRWLCIEKCDQAAVCQLIMQRYNAFRGLSLTHSIQDLIYLFQTPRAVYKKSLEGFQLLPATPLNGFRYAKRFYIEHPGKSSILTKYARDPASNISLLHPDYLNAVRTLGKESEFLDWACSRLKISTHPRLIDNSQNLTPEFKFLKNNAAIDLLLLLRDHWDMYYDHLNLKLTTAVSEMLVDCTDGLARRLDETALPLEKLKLEGPDLSFIAIPEHNDVRWLRFLHFGVLTNPSAAFYLRQLKALTSRPDSSTASKLSVQAAYAGLESSIGSFPREAQVEFTRHPLVFIEGLKRWVFLRDCVWGGPHLASAYHLSTEFPQYKKLFRDLLKLGNVTLDHVIQELDCVTSSTSFSRLEELLL
ncbi:uncharacterized protein K444DRAFT_72149 [Hyaloscypha bicolor E]|uniref:Uncharacterized protein n=1 Tax=Hyaloscypha bicolor E TaxID=1095630 RepID=A0A2J6SZA1_9HELO|nr:uncharacterized protein K444DRAFT_72149 [Hyaloscypha bicolor E]PMD56096.1 hypothetical protein K444DRAFT_72149 [Hyaloscypha bicolor E]